MTSPSESVPYGFCHCGCGQKTRIADRNRTRVGMVKGQPMRFISDHQAKSQTKLKPVELGIAPFRIDGNYCKLIPLTRGQFTIVSAHRYDELSQHRWKAGWAMTTKSYYVYRPQRTGRKTEKLYMARVIIGLQAGDPRTADHKNNTTLDNRDENIRIATPSQQARNRRRRSNSQIPLKGVVRAPKCHSKYVARIRVNGKNVYLGSRNTPEEAYKLYCEAAIKHYGDFAHL